MLRYIQFILLFVISISCNSQELVQVASYKQVELKLPSTWNYKSQEIESDFAYQISCWEKGGSNSFVFQWIETEMDLEDYLETMKESLKEQITHKNVVFTDNKVGNFQNNKTLYSTFAGELLDFKFSGKLIAFNNNGKHF